MCQCKLGADIYIPEMTPKRYALARLECKGPSQGRTGEPPLRAARHHIAAFAAQAGVEAEAAVKPREYYQAQVAAAAEARLRNEASVFGYWQARLTTPSTHHFHHHNHHHHHNCSWP